MIIHFDVVGFATAGHSHRLMNDLLVIYSAIYFCHSIQTVLSFATKAIVNLCSPLFFWSVDCALFFSRAVQFNSCSFQKPLI